MFILTTFSDLVQIPPHEFYKKSRDEIEDKINEKYANKVVQKVGLCLCMYDLLKASDGLIGHGTGNVNVNVEFRMIVFRPFKGEIILGKVQNQSAEGIRISTEFFEDIFVPSTMLFPGTAFGEGEEDVWVWNTDNNELYFDAGIIVRVRIETEHWEDQAPSGAAKKGEINGEQVKRKMPYSLVGSMMEEGLGDVDWW